MNGMKLVVCGLVVSAMVTSSASAIGIGLNPAFPLQGYDLGEGLYATLVGVQSPDSLVDLVISESDLDAAILSGSVFEWFYATGNSASAMFSAAPEAAFDPFVSDFVVAGASRPNRIWDSLYAIHSGTVVFSNGSGGTATMSTGGTRVTGQNPFQPNQVPDGGLSAGLLGMALSSLLALRRKLAA